MLSIDNMFKYFGFSFLKTNIFFIKNFKKVNIDISLSLVIINNTNIVEHSFCPSFSYFSNICNGMFF